MENLEALKHFRMVVDLLEDSVFNLVVLDDTQYTNFLYSLNENFCLQIALVIELSHKVRPILLERLKHLSLGLFLNI